MSSSAKSKSSLKGAITVLDDLIQAPQLLPDEDATTFEALRDVLFADLAPGTPYERLLARNLVDLEWEALRHRRFRDHLIRAEYRDIAVGGFQKGEDWLYSQLVPSETDKTNAFALVNSDPKPLVAAEKELAKLQISPSEILAKAYKKLSRDLEPHERQLAEIEVRRRRLREDYDRLKAAKAKPVEDAEILAAE